MRIGLNAHLLSFADGYRQAGVSRYIEALVRELPDLLAEDDDLVAFTGREFGANAALFDARIVWVRSRFRTSNPNLRILWEQTVGARLQPQYGLDLVHAPVNIGPLLGARPHIVTVHDLAFHHYPEQYPPAKRRYLQAMTRLSVWRADKVIAVSQATRNDLIELYDCSPDTISVIPNGVDSSFRPAAEDENACFRNSHELPENFMLFVGTLQPRKNLDTLLRAYASIMDQVDWPLVVIGGSGWQYDSIRRTIQRFDLQDRVRFEGYVSAASLPGWLSAASLLVLPSFYEGFGLPALEAMACGTAVAVSNTSALPEVVGDTGLQFNPNDQQDIATTLMRLVDNRDLRRQMAERGLTRAAEFSWRQTAARTYALYQELAGR